MNRLMILATLVAPLLAWGEIPWDEAAFWTKVNAHVAAGLPTGTAVSKSATPSGLDAGVFGAGESAAFGSLDNPFDSMVFGFSISNGSTLNSKAPSGFAILVR